MINLKHFQNFIPCGEKTTEGSGFRGDGLQSWLQPWHQSSTAVKTGFLHQQNEPFTSLGLLVDAITLLKSGQTDTEGFS